MKGFLWRFKVSYCPHPETMKVKGNISRFYKFHQLSVKLSVQVIWKWMVERFKILKIHSLL